LHHSAKDLREVNELVVAAALAPHSYHDEENPIAHPVGGRPAIHEQNHGTCGAQKQTGAAPDFSPEPAPEEVKR
jgi:hypothetical protein